jgi:hypothetical protein
MKILQFYFEGSPTSLFFKINRFPFQHIEFLPSILQNVYTFTLHYAKTVKYTIVFMFLLLYVFKFILLLCFMFKYVNFFVF